MATFPRNPYFQPTFDASLYDDSGEVGGVYAPYKPLPRQFQPPPLPAPKMTQQAPPPLLRPSVDGPQLQTDVSAPPPPQPVKKSETLQQFDELQARRPKPLSGPARYISALQRGGVLGVIGTALDKDAPKREQYAMDEAALMNRQKIQHQDTQDELTGIQREAYKKSVESQDEARKVAAQDRDDAREMQYLEHGISPVAPGEVADTQRYEYVQTPDGKQRKRMTPYAVNADKQAAAQADWPEVTPELAAAFPESLKAGQKINPLQLQQYTKLLETRSTQEGRSLSSQVQERLQMADQLGIKGRDREVYAATGHIERPPQVNVSMLNRQDNQQYEQELAKALAGGDLTRLRDVTGMRGDTRLRVYGMAKQLNPQFNPSDIDRKLKTIDYYANGKGADSLKSFDTFLQHASNAADAVASIKNTNVAVLNKPLNWVRANAASSPDYQRLITAIAPAVDEYMAFLLNNHALHEDDRKKADAILNGNMPVGAAIASIQEMAHIAGARLRSEDQRYYRTVGKHLADDVISDEAKQSASKLGLKLDISGSGAPPPLNAPGGQQQQKAPSVQIGQTVTLKNGQKVTVKAIHPDGTFDY